MALLYRRHMAYTAWVPNEGDPHAVVFESEMDTSRDDALKADAEQGRPSESPLSHPGGTYTPDELDLLAIYFTIVKVTYRGGALVTSARIVKVVEGARRARHLHLTSIRNEHAYYCCVAQLLAAPPSIPSLAGEDAAEGKPIVVCGDSHTLSPAWRHILVQGQVRRMIPFLVTGLKAWHLRPQSTFYPKVNFEAVVSRIPRGSDAIFIFCEIDCREGLLLAVEKDRYPNLKAGVRHVVGIYVRRLLDLSRDRSIRILVHPVAPVLNETRRVVVLFNTILKEEVEASAGNLFWLDFFDSLLEDNGNSFRKAFALDGTHMGPGYITCLGEAFESAVKNNEN